MYIPAFATAILSLASVVRAINVDKSSCEGGPWAPALKAGMGWNDVEDSHYFCEGGYVDGYVMTGLRIWRGDWAVWGLQFQWGLGDWGKVYGTDTDVKNNRRSPDQELKWQPTDEIEIKMKDNHGKDGLDAVGWIQVFVNGEDKLGQGSFHTGDIIAPDPGAKTIIALMGKSLSLVGQKGPVETIQFMYLESKIKSATMTSINFADSLDRFNSEKKGIEDDSVLGSIWFINDNPIGGFNQTFGVTDTASWTDEKSISTTRTHTIGATVGLGWKVDTGLPMLFSVHTDWSVGLSYAYAHETINEASESTTHSIAYTAGSTLAGVRPQYATLCTATAAKGTFNSAYVAEITAELENGNTFKYRDEGEYESINYVDAVAKCRSMPLQEMPPGVDGPTGTDEAPLPRARAISFRA